jgi:hypothetical protein
MQKPVGMITEQDVWRAFAERDCHDGTSRSPRSCFQTCSRVTPAAEFGGVLISAKQQRTHCAPGNSADY